MVLLALLACGDQGKTDPDQVHDTADPEQSICDASWDAWASGFFTTYCGACHSSSSPDRHGAPDGVDFDDVDMVQEWSGRIRARVLVDETMPMGGGVPPEALERLETWMDCVEAQP